MKKILLILIILLTGVNSQAQQVTEGIKIVFNNNGIQTQTFPLKSVSDWGYNQDAREVFVNMIDGTTLTFASNNFFQFEFIDIPVANSKENFKGYIQKGPYINGSSVTITQLDEEMNQTGKVFSTQIIDNSGNFEQKNIEFTSDFVELKADGYYFNEVRNQISNGTLTLYGLADICNLNSVNINILTHLERPRIYYLVANEDLSFAEAKKQARSEVLSIFGFSLPENIRSESLDIANDALLLAVSTIVQGHLSTGDMAELLANISSDIRADGVLNNPNLGSKLLNNAIYVDLLKVISNMNNKYGDLGIASNVTLDELTDYVQQFIENNKFEQTEFITYPESGMYGLNILADSFTEAISGYYESRYQYSMKAVLPAGNSSLKIVIRRETGGTWGGFNIVGIENWHCGSFDQTIGGNVFYVKDSEKANDLAVIFFDDCIIEYYENGATEPTKVKKIKVELKFPV